MPRRADYVSPGVRILERPGERLTLEADGEGVRVWRTIHAEGVGWSLHPVMPIHEIPRAELAAILRGLALVGEGLPDGGGPLGDGA